MEIIKITESNVCEYSVIIGTSLLCQSSVMHDNSVFNEIT